MREHLRLTVESQRMGWLDEDGERSRIAQEQANTQVRTWAAKAKLAATLSPEESLARLRLGIAGVLEARARARELDQVERRIVQQEADATKRMEAAQAESIAVARALGLDGGGTTDGAALAARVTMGKVLLTP